MTAHFEQGRNCNRFDVSIMLAFVLPAALLREVPLFFGICAAAFMPSISEHCIDQNHARQSGGVLSAAFHAVCFVGYFFIVRSRQNLGICQRLFGPYGINQQPSWPFVDPMVIALPVSALLLVAVTLLTSNCHADISASVLRISKYGNFDSVF